MYIDLLSLETKDFKTLLFQSMLRKKRRKAVDGIWKKKALSLQKAMICLIDPTLSRIFSAKDYDPLISSLKQRLYFDS